MTVMSDAFTKASPCTCAFRFTGAEGEFLRDGVALAAARVLSRNGKVSDKEFKRLMLQELGAMPLFDKLLESWRGDQSSRDTHASVVAPSTSPRTEPEGHGTRDTHIGHAPPARGQPSVPPTGGDITEGAQGSKATHVQAGPSVMSKTPLPPRELSASRKEAMLAARRDAARTIMNKLLPTGTGHHTIELGDLPVSLSSLKRLENAVGKRTQRDAVTYNIYRRWREYIEHTAHIPPHARVLKDLLSIKDVEALVESATITTIETLFSVPKELTARTAA